ncbi:hypothetical protein ACWEBX_01815 [Streptomyces sp. NPDC005070]
MVSAGVQEAAQAGPFALLQVAYPPSTGLTQQRGETRDDYLEVLDLLG